LTTGAFVVAAAGAALEVAGEDAAGVLDGVELEQPPARESAIIRITMDTINSKEPGLFFIITSCRKSIFVINN
jgi:hypothetical protein